MADATDSKSVVGDNVLVQVQSSAPSIVVESPLTSLPLFIFKDIETRYRLRFVTKLYKIETQANGQKLIAQFLNELLSKYPEIKGFASYRSMPTLLKGQNSFVGGCSSLLALALCKFMALIGKGKHLFPAIEKQNIDRIIEIPPPRKRS